MKTLFFQHRHWTRSSSRHLINILFSVCPPVSGGVDEVEVPETTAGSQEVFSHQRGAMAAAEEQSEQVPAERHDGEQLQEGENPDGGT